LLVKQLQQVNTGTQPAGPRPNHLNGQHRASSCSAPARRSLVWKPCGAAASQQRLSSPYHILKSIRLMFCEALLKFKSPW